LKLETEIGTPLFDRNRRGVRPTPAGDVLLRHIRETMSDYRRTTAEIANLAGIMSGSVSIISLESLAVRFMPRVIEELSARHPHVTFTLLVVDPGEIGDALRSERNDFGVLFVDERHRGIDIVGDIRTSIGAVMRPDHPLARRRQVTLTECAAHPVVMLHDLWLIDAIMATEFSQSGARFTPRIVSNSIEFMRQLILAGLGIGFFTPIGFIDEIRRGELVHVPLAEPGLVNSRIGILVPRQKRLSPPAVLAIEHIRQKLAALAHDLLAPLAAPKRSAGRRRGA
jgi:DNA-binding transcriptional LysR family regulator